MSLPQIIPVPGFICKALRSGKSGSKVFLNICGNAAVEFPKGYSGETISDSWLKANPTIDNLQIPIAVGRPHAAADHNGEGAVAVDVLINDRLLQWGLTLTGTVSDNFKLRLLKLAVEWVEKECEIFLDHATAKVIQGKYKGTLQSFVPADMSQVEPTPDPSPVEKERTKPNAGIQELPSKEPVIKRGFLDKKGGALYPEGTTSEGVLPEGAGDPLGHIPKSLRERAKIIDTRTTPLPPTTPAAPAPAAPKPKTTMQPAVPSHPNPSKVEEIIEEGRIRIPPSTVKQPKEMPELGVITPGMSEDIARLMQEFGEMNNNNGVDHRKAQLIKEYDQKHKAWPYLVDLSEDRGSVTVRVQVPENINGSAIDADVTSDHIDFGNFIIPFKVKVDAENASAQFSKKTRVFTVTASVLPST